jgi:hypothetical protein
MDSYQIMSQTLNLKKNNKDCLNRNKQFLACGDIAGKLLIYQIKPNFRDKIDIYNSSITIDQSPSPPSTLKSTTPAHSIRSVNTKIVSDQHSIQVQSL